MRRSRGSDAVVDLEAQAGPPAMASPRIKAHHGDNTARQHLQPASVLMTLLVVAIWCAMQLGDMAICFVSFHVMHVNL